MTNSQTPSTARTVSIPGSVYALLGGGEAMQGPVETRAARSGYSEAMIRGLANARGIARGRGRSYSAYLTPEACDDLYEWLEALAIGARQSGETTEARAIEATMHRLGAS